MDDTRISRYISMLLRHHPEAAGITVDRHGWANVEELIAGVSRKFPIDRADLERIVVRDKKDRYSLSPDGTKIRANQGHSIDVDVELEEKEPPEVLYHGTAERFAASIEHEGLKPQGRLYVHLSKDEKTARIVGQRHGKPVIFTVKAGEMFRAGHKFYLSVNNVWLTEKVPPEYLAVLQLTHPN